MQGAEPEPGRPGEHAEHHQEEGGGLNLQKTCRSASQ